MEKKNMSLTELMKSLYAERDMEEPETMQITPPKKLDIGQCIREVTKGLAIFRPEENAQHIIEKFITFRIRTKGMTTPEQRMSLYNLLLICEESTTALEVTNIFADALGIPKRAVRTCTEAEAIRRSHRLLTPETKLLLIHDCQEMPRLNIDGNGSAREESRKRIEAYNELWENLIAHVQEYPETIIFVSGNNAVYRSAMRPNTLLSRKLCAGHVHLREMSVDSLLESCLDKFR